MSKILMLGVGGSGMRGLAWLLAEGGQDIIGADQNHEAVNSAADLTDIKIVNEKVALDYLTEVKLLIYSDAVADTHRVRKAAADLNIPEQSYSEALGEMSAKYTTVAITGTHGKSSTTGMLSHILVEAGLDPTVLIGAPVSKWSGRGVRLGKSSLLVVEADEYREHFLSLQPKLAIITNIDFDHPDCFNSISEVEQAFAKFVKLIPKEGRLIVPETEVLAHTDIKWPSQMTTIDQKTAEQIELKIPGTHMQMNGALAVGMAEILGVERAAAWRMLRGWEGVGRRFEKLGEIKGMELISDYGHNPAEIAATLTGAKKRYIGKRILVILEIHTLERLKRFRIEFARSLGNADGVVLAPVFTPVGREHEEAGRANAWRDEVSTALTAMKIKNWQFDDLRDLVNSLSSYADSFDVALAFSAGSLDSELRNLV